MTVSFDLDDTAWKYRVEFAALAHALKAAGHQIGMLTGHGNSARESDLRLWEERGFPPADFLYNADDCQLAGIPWHGTPQRTWKLDLAYRKGVDMHFDDFGNLNDFRIECWVAGQGHPKDPGT